MGSSSRPSSQTTTQVRQEYPAYFQPYLEEVLGDAQAQFGRQYEPFPEPLLVDVPEARTQALTDLQSSGLAELSQPHYEAALAGTEEAGKSFPELDIDSYMNPYRDLVTDRLVEKAAERRGVERKRISDAAARAGAFGGSRHGVTEGMFDEATQEQLQDIEDRGKMNAFQNALAAAQADRSSGLAAAGQRATIGQAQQEAKTKGLIGIEKAATAEQAIEQQKRDIAKGQFYQEEQFPQQKLAEYSAIIRGHTPPPSRFETSNIKESYSPLQVGVGALGALGGMFGGGKKEGGAIGYHSGGLTSLDPDSGMSTEEVVNRSIRTLQDMAHNTPQSYTNKGQQHRLELSDEREIFNNEMERLEKADDLEKRQRRWERGEPLDDPDWPKLHTPIRSPRTPGRHIDHDQFKQMERGGINRIAQAPHQEEAGLQGLAYGGVPGQAYTEDIGMMGGLGAVAGPQMRFAYGGVPGQPYTEDIGMMGGLASVAGPQMRFAEGHTVPVWEDLKKVGRAAAPLAGELAYGTANVLGYPVDVIGGAMNYLTGLDTRDSIGGSQNLKRILDSAGVPYLDSPPDETEKASAAAVQDAHGGVWERLEDIEMGRKDEPPKEPDAAPEEEEEVEEEAWHKKYLGLDKRETIGAGLMMMGGRTQDLVGVGKTLLSKKDASDLDKRYKESLIKLSEARTETEKGKAGRDALRILSTMHKNNRDFRLKVRELAQKILQQNDTQALNTWKEFAKNNQMYVMTMLQGEGDAEAMKKNPQAHIDKFREIIARFNNNYPPQGEVEVTSSVEETQKATGGSIPHTLSKLGISSIRKV